MFRQQVKQGVTILELRCQLPVSSGKLIDMLRKIPNVFITGTGRKTDPFIYFIKGISEVPPDARPITRTIHFPPTPLTQPPSSL